MYKKISLFVAALALFLTPHLSHAQSATGTQMLTGWAWSSNIGWVSFNCANFGTCLSNSEYKVVLNADGTLTGDAWSSNIGWIHFGNLSGFPSGAGTSASNAQLGGSSFSGWSKALAAAGGWDGWLSLGGRTTTNVNVDNAPLPVGSSTPAAGTQGSYGVTVSGDDLSGFAWGSDVVGWLSFSGPGYGVHIVPNDDTTDSAASSTDCYGPDGYYIPDGHDRVYYKYASADLSPDNSCSDLQDRVCHAGVLSGSYVNPTCGTGAAAGFTAGVAPKLTLSIARQGGTFSHGPLVISKGTPVTVKWSFDPSGGAPDSCVAAGGLLNAAISLAGGTLDISALNASQTFTLTCSNSIGASTDSVRAVVQTIIEF